MAAAATTASCSGQTGQTAKTVRAYSPEMNHMEMLSMTQQPGWSLLAGTQWLGTAYTNVVKGVNEQLNACFCSDGGRSYTQSPMFKSGTSDGKSIYLNLMSTVDYLDFVFRRQFPVIKDAVRTKVKTLEQYTEEERRELEEMRVKYYNAAVQYIAQSPGREYVHLRGVTADRVTVEYEFVQDGETVRHSMEAVMTAMYQDFRGPYLNSSDIIWGQRQLLTVTAPAKSFDRAMKDVERMTSTVRFNEQYVAAIDHITMQGIQRSQQDSQRIMNEMAQAEIRHQQNMARQIQETHEYVMRVQRESFANQQASSQRVSQGWRDAIVGVDRYVGVDGEVLEVPVSMGSKVWQSADGGTIYTSDSYLFNPVDFAMDKDGNLTEFRQLQLLK